MQKLVTNLWFDTQAEEAAAFYVSLFDNSEILRTTRYGDVGTEITGKEAGTVMTVEFVLDGQRFTALNGGPDFKFSEAISIMINCESQEEVDRLWDALTADGGQPSQCGWLKDKYGLSWQVTPTRLDELMSDPDPEKSARTMGAMLKMTKLDIAELERAHDGKIE